MSKLSLLAGPAMLVISGATLYATANDAAPTAKANIAKQPTATVAPAARVTVASVAVATVPGTAQVAQAKVDNTKTTAAPQVAAERRVSVEHAAAPAAASAAVSAAVLSEEKPVPAKEPTAQTANEKTVNEKTVAKPVERKQRGELPGRWLGMKLEALTGIRVSDVASESMAARYGLRPGDVLLSVEGRPLTRVEELMAAVRENRRPVLSFTVLRGGRTFRMLVDAQPEMTPAAEVPAASESRAVRVGSKSFSNDLGGVVLVRSAANGPVHFSAVFRDADGANRSLQFSGETNDLLDRIAALPASLRQVVVEWLRD